MKSIPYPFNALGMFDKKTAPEMPVVPTKDSQEVARAALEAKQAARMRSGRASTILTGGTGITEPVPGAVKSLLGQ